MFNPSTSARVVAFLATTMLAAVATHADNLLLNPGAEQGKSENPSIWERASVAADGMEMERTAEQFRNGKYSLMISNDHVYEKPVANNWMQSLQEVPRGKVLRVAAAVHTKNVDSANVCLQCWDSTGENLLAFGSTPVIRGDQEWARFTSGPVIVPESTASIIIRASLLGTGMAFFDDLEVTAENQSNKEDHSGGDAKSGSSKAADEELVKQLPGRVVERISITKDCMVLAYLKDWQHGEVDNIAVANNDGGVRTLLAWKPLTAKSLPDPNHKVFLALYSRKTTAGPDASEITLSSAAKKWPENTSWETQPKAGADSVATNFEPGNGWKLFDITPLLHKTSSANQYGVIVNFKQEKQQAGEKSNWSGYEFVSREGLGDWEHRRPQLFVIEKAAAKDNAETK